MTGYDGAYYDDLAPGSRRSADRVLPLVFDLLTPRRVADFGCGSGAWLAAAQALGAEITGLDGDWLPRDRLEVAPERVQAADLTEPVDLGARFDLALCLEVAEHLPAAAAATLVASLVRHAPAVLFSAAVPGQGGTGHIHEAWPTVWRDLFAQHGYACHDVIRGRIWTDRAIDVWYRQNLLLFLGPDAPVPDRAPVAAPLSVVHPDLWEERDATLAQHGADLAAAKAEVVRLGHEWQARADEGAAWRARAEALEADLAQRTAERDALTGSRSWRLTAPLRRLHRMVQALRGERSR